jgi:hypothetical protein
LALPAPAHRSSPLLVLWSSHPGQRHRPRHELRSPERGTLALALEGSSVAPPPARAVMRAYRLHLHFSWRYSGWPSGGAGRHGGDPSPVLWLHLAGHLHDSSSLPDLRSHHRLPDERTVPLCVTGASTGRMQAICTAVTPSCLPASRRGGTSAGTSCGTFVP